MAKYKQIRRNGRWITVDESGKEVGVGQGYLRDVARSIRDIGVYSDKTDKQGNPLTIRQAKDQASTPKPKPKPKPESKPKPKAEVKPKPKPKPKAAEVKPTKPPVRGSQQPTTTTKPPVKPARTETKPKADSKPMEKAYGESGKELYQAAKKNNPLMQRTFGYQTGEAPSQKTEKETPTSKQGSSASSTFEQNKLKIEQDKTAKPFDVRGVFPKKKKK